MDTIVNGEPVPETTGSTGVRWEDTPNRHAYCDGEIRRLREQLAVIGYFADTWRELFTDMPDSYRCTYTCAEANAAAELYRALGDDATAKAIIAAHAAYDEEGDQHYHGAGRDAYPDRGAAELAL